MTRRDMMNVHCWRKLEKKKKRITLHPSKGIQHANLETFKCFLSVKFSDLKPQINTKNPLDNLHPLII